MPGPEVLRGEQARVVAPRHQRLQDPLGRGCGVEHDDLAVALGGAGVGERGDAAQRGGAGWGGQHPRRGAEGPQGWLDVNLDAGAGDGRDGGGPRRHRRAQRGPPQPRRRSLHREHRRAGQAQPLPPAAVEPSQGDHLAGPDRQVHQAQGLGHAEARRPGARVPRRSLDPGSGRRTRSWWRRRRRAPRPSPGRRSPTAPSGADPPAPRAPAPAASASRSTASAPTGPAVMASTGCPHAVTAAQGPLERGGIGRGQAGGARRRCGRGHRSGPTSGRRSTHFRAAAIMCAGTRRRARPRDRST